MLQDKSALAKRLMPYFTSIGRERKQAQELCDKLKKEYNLPPVICSDILSTRRSLEDCNELICYWIVQGIKKELTIEFFTNKEIKDFAGLQYEDEKPILPLKVPMLEVNDDQWIGVIDIKTLMRMRKEGLIHYNAETQRALKLMIRGEEHIYKPYTNRRAVNEIFELIDDNSFIPNTLTLNMPPADENMEYDFAGGIMTIKSISHFDIVDGYHRLKAFERKYDKDPKYNCKVELRLTTFSVTKAKQFIFQEDHNNKMPRVDVISYDQRNDVNKIIQRINNDIDFDMRGEICVNGGLIHAGMAAKALSSALPKAKLSAAQITKYVSDYVYKLNVIVRKRPDFTTKKWDGIQIKTVFGNLNEPAEAILRELETIKP